jgi:hypothetical protein
MKKAFRPIVSPEQQQVLDGVQVRLVTALDERRRFDAVVVEGHYLHNVTIVGEQLRYVAEYQGQWVALMIWSAGAYKLKLREEWIGWSDRQKKRRLSLVVNNSRFFIPEPYHIPNLASRVMKLVFQRLCADWQQTYGHGVLIAETFVDRNRFQGTSYKASGWTLLGKTKGFERSRKDFYQAHDQPKELWVRELREGARTVLRGPNLPKDCVSCQKDAPPDCPQSPEELSRMRSFFGTLPEWRRRRRCPHSVSSLAAATICAMLCKVCLGQRDLAAFGRNLTREQMKGLGFPRDRDKRIHTYIPPSETTFARFVSHLDNQALQRELQRWLDHLLGARDPAGDQVSVDGKELLNSQGAAVVSAYSVSTGRWLGSEPVAEGSNEIPAAQHLLRRLDLDGSLVTADALHTQTETGRIIVQEKGGDYLFTVKGNQKGVADNVRELHHKLSRGFSPSAHRADL